MSIASDIQLRKAAVVIIGDEVLLGETLDSNSGEICRQLLANGILVGNITTVSDSKKAIVAAIQYAMQEHNIIITSGGLGPTLDDKTRDAMAELLNLPLIEHVEALEWIQNYFKKEAKRPMNQLNNKQALVPKGSQPIQNEVGTAPAIWTEFKEKIIVNLPGVPSELQHALENTIMPKLQKQVGDGYFRFVYVYTENIPESELAVKLQDFEESLPEHYSLAYLPNKRKVKLRLSGLAKNQDELQDNLKKLSEDLMKIVPSASIIPFENWEEKLASLHKENSFTISSAESFTSGRIANLITTVSGSSMYLKGALVAYDKKVKTDILGISENLINQKGVVNEEVAKNMAINCRKMFSTDFAVSTTGVAGSEKDEHGADPKTAYIAVATPTETKIFFFEKPGLSRKDFTETLAQKGIELLHNSIKDYFQKNNNHENSEE